MFGRKVKVEALARDNRAMGPVHVNVSCDASQMNRVTAKVEVHYRACQAMGVSDKDAHNVEIYSYRILD